MVAIISPPPIAEVRPSNYIPLIRGNGASQQYQSMERQSLEKFKDEIFKKLTVAEKQLNTQPEDDYPEYSPLPPKRTFTVKARIRYGGRTQPLPYPIDTE
jgi:hypothetical protein